MDNSKKLILADFKGMNFLSWHTSVFTRHSVSALLYDNQGKKYFEDALPAFVREPSVSSSHEANIAGRELTLELNSSSEINIRNVSLLLKNDTGGVVGVCLAVLLSTGSKTDYNEFYVFLSAWKSRN